MPYSKGKEITVVRYSLHADNKPLTAGLVVIGETKSGPNFSWTKQKTDFESRFTDLTVTRYTLETKIGDRKFHEIHLGLTEGKGDLPTPRISLAVAEIQWPAFLISVRYLSGVLQIPSLITLKIGKLDAVIPKSLLHAGQTAPFFDTPNGRSRMRTRVRVQELQTGAHESGISRSRPRLPWGWQVGVAGTPLPLPPRTFSTASAADTARTETEASASVRLANCKCNHILRLTTDN